MHARVGDEILVDGAHLGDPRRSGEVIEVREQGGVIHYSVRWEDGHESIFFPGSDAHAIHPGGRSKVARSA